MISFDDLERLHDVLLEDAYIAFKKEHGYDPRHSSDKLKPSGNPDHYKDINNNTIYEFCYIEVTPHDCPYGVTLEINEKDLIEILKILNI